MALVLRLVRCPASASASLLVCCALVCDGLFHGAAIEPGEPRGCVCVQLDDAIRLSGDGDDRVVLLENMFRVLGERGLEDHRSVVEMLLRDGAAE
jgi:hypothetical protein